MGRKSTYFALSLDSLRALGSWAADCAERALPVFEKHAPSDFRPRAAIEGIRVFAGGGKRTAQLRTLALSAHSAAREAGDSAAAAAARAAGSAAASAYTHPLADVHQTKHVVGSAAYAALALELAHSGNVRIGAGEVRWALKRVPSEVRAVLLQMPSRQAGNSRLDNLLYELDAGIRRRIAEKAAGAAVGAKAHLSRTRDVRRHGHSLQGRDYRKRRNPPPHGEASETRVPTDLRQALAAVPMAKAQWEDLTPIARRDFVGWIDSAKQAETRRRRIEKACAMLAAGKRRPCCYSIVSFNLYTALAATPRAKVQWRDLTPSERRDFIRWMDSAKQPEAHRRRIEKACAMLAAGKRCP